MKNSSTVDGRVSSLAREMRPYWQRDLDRAQLRGNGNGSGSGGAGGSISVHDLDGAYHTGTLSDSQGPQFALLDGSRTFTGDIELTPGLTIDGVDLSAHVADPNAHHFRATGGAGILVSGDSQIISVRTTGDGSGLSFDGAGDLYLEVKEGVEIDGNALRVDAGYAFHWTNDHTHSGNIEFSGDRSILSTPGSDLLIDLGTPASPGDLLLADDQTFRSDDYSDGIPIAGFSLHQTPAGVRQLTIASLKADEMHVRAFVADTVRVDVGEEWWGKSMGLLYEPFTTPASIGATATMILEDSPALDGALFSSGDWVMLRLIELPPAGTTAEADVAYIWGQVSAYVNLTADANGQGRQQWTFTLRSGPTAVTLPKGQLVVDFGTVGQGFIHLSTLDSADGPWLRIGDWTGANPYAAGSMQTRTQIGRLDGISDTELNPTGWGLYSDNAFLRGLLRTPEAILDDDGLAILHPNVASSDDPGAHAKVAWWPDLDDRSGNPVARIAAWTNTIGPDVDYLSLEARTRSSSTGAIVKIQAIGSDTSTLLVDGRGAISLQTTLISAQGHLRPNLDLTHDLGTAALRWRQLHVDQLFVTGSISGDTLSGAEWEFPGSMIIDPHSAGATTVSITNQGTGTASLSVEGNITLGGTVDGVDIAAHDADPSAHHELATGGDGITVSGAQVVAVNSTVVRTTRQVIAGDGLDGGGALSSNVTLDVDTTVVRTDRQIISGDGLAGGGDLSANRTLEVGAGDGIAVGAHTVNVDGTVVRITRTLTAGAGLTGGGALSADRSFAVGAGDGITVNADDIAVRLATHSGLQFSVGQLQMGTPEDLTKDTTSAVSGTTHRHNIISTADAYTEPGKILHATDVAGGLILGTLDVMGNLQVLNGGDLVVGATNVIFADVSANSVGFGRVPDPQFMVDVNGPLRADYLIGKHAIQVKDAVLIAHYDGADPISANYVGEANGHFGQVASMAGGVIFRPGNFGKALQVAGAATNRITNPSFETNTTNWTALGGSTITRTNEEAYAGSYSLKIATPAGVANKGAVMTQAVATGPITYTASLYIKGDSQGESLFLRARNQADNANLATTTFTLDPSEEWKLVQVTWTSDSGQTTLRLRIHDAAAAALTYYVDALMVEQTAYATPYVDGSLIKDGSDTGHFWTSTVHGSTSARTAAQFSYPLANLPYGRGTVMVWARAPWVAAAASRGGPSYLWNASNAYLRIGTNGRLTALIHGLGISPTQVMTDDQWHHYALTWDGYENTATLYIDGQAPNSSHSGTGLVLAAYTAAALYVGGRVAGADPWDGWLDDFATIARDLPASEIRSIYESEAPIFAESSVFSFRATPKGLVWADDEGLWVKDVNGQAVAAFYGGEAANKSWGGLAGANGLNAGDIFFGRYGASDGGWMRWDRDGSVGAPLLTLGYKEAAVLTLSSTAAKLQGANLEMFTGSDEFLGVFAQAPAGGSWGGLSGANAPAAGDVMIGDYDRGAAMLWDDSALAVYIGGKPAHLGGTGSYFAASVANAGIIRNGQFRIRMNNNTGDFTINDSGGAAVFTFNSSLGAEFTLPLTLGANGGIYQGSSGSFSSPNTGLKIYNDSNVGRLSTYNAGVEQVTLDTLGKLKAGAGAVQMDANGITITRAAGTSLNDVNAYAFANSVPTVIGGLYAYTPASSSQMTLRQNISAASTHADLKIENVTASTGSSSITLTATRTGGGDSAIITLDNLVAGVGAVITLSGDVIGIDADNNLQIDTAAFDLNATTVDLGMIYATATAVGIGNTTPTANEAASRLTVRGSDASALYGSIENSSSGHAGLVVRRTGGIASRWQLYTPSGSTDWRINNGSDRMTLTAAGVLTPAGGISFGAETLSTYDEDSTGWTPNITASTPGTLSVSYVAASTKGKYTRIGNVVFYTFLCTTNTVTIGTASGELRISLPLPVAAGAPNGTLGAVSMSGYDLTGTPSSLAFNPNAGTSYGTILAVNDNAAWTNQPIGGLASGDSFIASGFYFTS